MEKFDRDFTLFAVDGNYFAHRALGILNGKDKVNNLQTMEEMRHFTNMMHSLFRDTMDNAPLIADSVVFTRDRNSWRKTLQYPTPYYLENSDSSYKANRSKVKEESPINYENFNRLSDDFYARIAKMGIPVVDINGLEGDDSLCLLAEKAKTHNFKLIILCTDGDIEQCCNENTVVYKNVRSKNVQNGELVMHIKTYSDYNDTESYEQMLLNNRGDKNFITRLYEHSIYSTQQNKIEVKRSINQGVRISHPYRMALLKSIGGDKKDNIRSVLGWVSGNKTYKITEKMIEKAAKKVGLNLYIESECMEYFGKDAAPKFKALLLQLIADNKKFKAVDIEQELYTCDMVIDGETKPVQFDLKKVMEHLGVNIRAILLQRSNLPELFVNEFDEWFADTDFTDGVFEKSLRISGAPKSASNEMLEDALPDELKDLMDLC